MGLTPSNGSQEADVTGKAGTARAELDAQIARMVRTLRYQRLMLLAIGLLWFGCEAFTLSAL